MAKDATTIRISTNLRERLKKLGRKGETYEDIIERLLEKALSNMGEKID
jgi:predicted DNA-binding protein